MNEKYNLCLIRVRSAVGILQYSFLFVTDLNREYSYFMSVISKSLKQMPEHYREKLRAMLRFDIDNFLQKI